MKKKRYFWVLMFIVIFLLGIKSDVKAETSQDGRFTYEILNDGSIEITGYNADEQTLVIPSEIDGYQVSGIGNEAFYNASAVSVTISDGISTIGEAAFGSCHYMTNIEIPQSVRTIEKDAFIYCKNLLEVKIPKAVTCINEGVFTYCTNLKKIDISETITEIKESAFSNCESLEEITIPEQSYIGDATFFNCNSLTNITIPETVESIGWIAFKGCDSLSQIDLPENLTEIGEAAFSYCGITEMTIPDTITVLPESVFQGCEKLKEVHLSKNLKTLDAYSFSFCSSLENIEIPEGVTEIQSTVFSLCTGLKTVKLPETLVNIEEMAFDWCTSLQKITLPSSVTQIDENPFTGCISLEEINVATGNQYFSSKNGVLFNQKENKLVAYPFGKKDSKYSVPEGTVAIGKSAFAYAEGSLNTVELPESIERIEAAAFNSSLSAYVGVFEYGGKSSITSIKINNPSCHIFDDEDNEEGSYVFYQGEDTIFKDITIYGYPNSTAEAYAKKYNRKFIDIRTGCSSTNGTETNNISNANKDSFSYPSKNTILKDEKSKALYSVSVPGKEIQYKAPVNKKMKVVSIPSKITVGGITYKVTGIATNAFKNCKKLKKVIITKNVTTIGNKAFTGCKNLKNIIIKSRVLKEIGKNSFKGIDKKVKIKVPKKKFNSYKKLLKKAKLGKSVRIIK